MFIETKYYDGGNVQVKLVQDSKTISTDHYDQYCDDVKEGNHIDVGNWIYNNLINAKDYDKLTSQLCAGLTIDITCNC